MKPKVSITNSKSGFWMKIGVVTKVSKGAMGTMYEVTFNVPTANGITSSMFFESELETV